MPSRDKSAGDEAASILSTHTHRRSVRLRLTPHREVFCLVRFLRVRSKAPSEGLLPSTNAVVVLQQQISRTIFRLRSGDPFRARTHTHLTIEQFIVVTLRSHVYKLIATGWAHRGSAKYGDCCCPATRNAVNRSTSPPSSDRCEWWMLAVSHSGADSCAAGACGLGVDSTEADPLPIVVCGSRAVRARLMS